MSQAETNFRSELLMALSKRFHPHGLFSRRVVSLLFAQDGHPVMVGKKGQADIEGMVMLPGMAYAVAVEIETKATTRQSPEQKAWQDSVQRAGGIYLMAYAKFGVEEAIKALELAIIAKSYR